jgi:hypothetical protein
MRGILFHVPLPSWLHISAVVKYVNAIPIGTLQGTGTFLVTMQWTLSVSFKMIRSVILHMVQLRIHENTPILYRHLNFIVFPNVAYLLHTKRINAWSCILRHLYTAYCWKLPAIDVLFNGYGLRSTLVHNVLMLHSRTVLVSQHSAKCWPCTIITSNDVLN